MSALLSPTFLAKPATSYEEFIREKVAFDRSFGFKVQDVGGTANGGVDTSSEHVFTVHTDRLVTTTNSNGNNTLNGGSGNDVVLGDTGGIIQTVEAGKNYNIR